MQKKNIQEKRIQEVVKQKYQRPQLGKVSLFADQVLSMCGADASCKNPEAFVAGYGSA